MLRTPAQSRPSSRREETRDMHLHRVFVLVVSSMLRVVVKLHYLDRCMTLRSLERARRRADRPPISGPRRRPAERVPLCRRAHALFGDEVRVDARPRLLSELAREARPPETVQSQAEHDGCGTFFVTVARGAPDTTRTRSTRARASAHYARFNTAPAGRTPAVAYRQSAIKSLRARATMPTRRARFPRPKRS